MTKSESVFKRYGWAAAFAVFALVYAMLDPNASSVSTGSAVLNSVIPVGKQGAFVDLNPFPLAGNVGFAFYFSALLYYVCTAAIGVFLLSPFVGVAGGTGLSGLTWGLAGIAPGYLAVTMLNRLCTLIWPNGSAVFAIWFVMLSVLAFVLLKTPAVKKTLSLAGLQRTALWVLASLGLAFIFLIHNIESGGGFIAGDGLRAYVDYLTAQATKDFNPAAHFPLADLHYDELMFNYGLAFLKPFFNSLHDAPVVLYFWLWRGLGKVSCLFLCYALFRWQKLPKVFSIAATAFLFFGTNSLNPLYYLVSFDTLNPLLYNVTAARVLTVLLPFLLVALIDLAGKKGWDRKLALSVGTLGLGISAISFHTSWYVFAFLLVYVIGETLEKEPSAKDLAMRKSRYWSGISLLTVLFAGYTLNPAIGSDHRKIELPMLGTIVLILGLAIGLSWLKQGSRSSIKRIWMGAAAALAVFLLICAFKTRWIHFRHALIFSALAGLIWPLSKRPTFTAAQLAKLKHFFAALVLVLLCVTYVKSMMIVRNHRWMAFLPLIAIAMGGVFWFLDLRLSRERARVFFASSRARLVGLGLGMTALGCFFLGNSPAKILLPKMGVKTSWLPLRDVVDLNAPKYFFTPMNCDSGPSQHCLGFGHFLGYYGLFLLAAVMAYLLLERNRDSSHAVLKTRLQRFTVLSVVLMCFGFLMSDFMWLAIRPWYMTRLIEAATYFVMIVFFLTVGNFGGRRLMGAVNAFCAIWSVLPFLLSHRLEQWVANLGFFLGK